MTDEHVDLIAGSENAGARLDRFLAATQPSLSRVRWQQLIEEGHVELNGKQAKPNSTLHVGDRITATVPPPQEARPLPENIPLDIAYEDADLIVVNKPAGMVVHPGAGNYTGTLVNALLFHCKDLSGIGGVARPGIVHRIDKDTSGLLVVAKNDLTHRHLAAQFEAHSIKRVYEAIAWGLFRGKAGTLTGTIERDPRNRQRMTGKTGGGRKAVTHYEVVGETPHFSRLKCKLETGRTHQIRVQLAEAGHPLVGDPVYGQTRSISPRMGVRLQQAVRSFGRQALHAAVLGFADRKGKAHYFEAPVTGDFEDLWALMLTEDHS
jgi:23S rRNA pseudouridine1911/1915/1917 synthase